MSEENISSLLIESAGCLLLAGLPAPANQKTMSNRFTSQILHPLYADNSPNPEQIKSTSYAYSRPTDLQSFAEIEEKIKPTQYTFKGAGDNAAVLPQ